MLSLEHQTIYDIIRAIAVDLDVYKVLEAEEILEKVPAGIRISKIQLSSIIRDLKELDYITVKYFTPDEYCLLVRKLIDDVAKPQSAPLQVLEQPQTERVLYSEKREQKKTEKEQKTVGLGRVFFMAFLGAFLASGIVAAISAIIIRLV